MRGEKYFTRFVCTEVLPVLFFHGCMTDLKKKKKKIEALVMFFFFFSKAGDIEMNIFPAVVMEAYDTGAPLLKSSACKKSRGFWFTKELY